MSELTLDCTTAREADYADRYVTGRLSDPEAEAFEAHYFACEACWDDVRMAMELRAALDSPDTERTRPRPGRRGLRWMGWAAGLAAAAVAAFLVFDVYDGGSGGPEEVFRGPDTPLQLEARVAGGALVAEWGEVPDADLYVARVYTEDGRLLYEREMSEPRAEVTAAELRDGPTSGRVYWRIVALDDLRRPIGRSPLVPARLPSP